MIETLHYDQPLYRPPSEGNNLIIQATIGCSFNRCTFCSMYRSKSFHTRPLEHVLKDIDRAAQLDPRAHRVFLADGDAMVLPVDHLVAILEHLYARLPDLQRVTSYALPANLAKKSLEDLKQLRRAGLKLIYYGIESGSADILKKITKGATPRSMVEGLNKASDAGMKISATVILGLGGKNHWQSHIDETAELVNKVRLNFLSTLQLGLGPDVEAEFMTRFGSSFAWQDDAGMLEEQKRLVAKVSPARPVIFRSNHASNALPLKGVLPKDREPLLARLGAASGGQIPLVPKWMRGY